MRSSKLRAIALAGAALVTGISIVAMPIPGLAYYNYVTNNGTIGFNSGQHTFSTGGLTNFMCYGGGGTCPAEPEYAVYDSMVVTAKKTVCGFGQVCPGFKYEVDLGGEGSIDIYSNGSRGATANFGVSEQETITTVGPPDAISVPPGRPESISTSATTYFWAPTQNLESCTATYCNNNWGGAYAILFETQNCPLSATTESIGVASWSGDPLETTTALDEVAFSGC